MFMNFDFIKTFKGFQKLYQTCVTAEQLCFSNPQMSITASRISNEYIIRFIYTAKVSKIATLSAFEMLSSEGFVQAIDNDQTLLSAMHSIRKIGNLATHSDAEINSDDAVYTLEELHFIVGEFFISLKLIDDYPSFIKPIEPQIALEPVMEEKPQEEIPVEEEVVAKYASSMKFVHFAKMSEENFELNRKKYIEACLTESSWKIVQKEGVILPNCVTLNFALNNGEKIDYVFTGSDNKPLAIVELTVSSQNIIKGREKAYKQAEALEQTFGYKPIVYYTNGYVIYCQDWLGFEPRRVFTFHNTKELELLILRKTTRTPIDNPVINQAIVNRKYQNESVQKICEVFSGGRRRSLLVLATGTGKTRVSIAAVDVLLKNNWVKNVLFLADRKSLVHQAHKAFTKLLPSATTSIFSADSLDKNPNARIIFSTYQSMMPMINGESKEFGVGRFDLIIIDEAHRSVFDKFGAIFSYFDGLIIGLTATPKNDQSKSTYEVLKIDSEQPDYDYSLDKAVEEGYLVGFSIINRTTKMNERHFRYCDLSDEEKQKNEAQFSIIDDDEEKEEEMSDAKKLSGRVVNIPTIDIMLNDLMTEGLSVDGGDKIGKTIIFAKSHFEASIIVERFNALYGASLGNEFCTLIDSTVPNALTLIDKFTSRDSLPQIAVTVSLLDTGVDVPDILNLVFFKELKSKIKFLQMIGRGTRLSNDIFGPGINKSQFYIFDYYDNFNYFKDKDGKYTTVGDKPSKRMKFSYNFYGTLLKIAHYLYLLEEPTEFEFNYAENIKKDLFSQTQKLVNDRIAVQQSIAYVNKYRDINNWILSRMEVCDEINNKVTCLFDSYPGSYRIKVFDYSMYRVELALLHRIFGEKTIGFGSTTSFIGKTIAFICKSLLKKTNIPAVDAKKDIISELSEIEKIDDLTVEKCEYYRENIRDLIQFVDFPNYYYRFVIDDELVVPTVSEQGSDIDKAFTDYLKTNNPTFIKLMTLQPLTKDEYDELNSDIQGLLNGAPLSNLTKGVPLLIFMRSKLGIEDQAIMSAFGHFLNNVILNDEQLEYCNNIIEYTKVNGDFVPQNLMTVSPFCDKNVNSLFGADITYLQELIKGLHEPIREDNF